MWITQNLLPPFWRLPLCALQDVGKEQLSRPWNGDQNLVSVCLPRMFFVILGFFSPLWQESAPSFPLPIGMLFWVFFLSLALWVSSVQGVMSDIQYLTFIYLFPCCVGTLSIYGWGFFHFHSLVFTSYWWKGIPGTFFFSVNTHSNVFFFQTCL